MKNTHPVEVIPILGSAASSPTLLAKNDISIGSTSIDAPVESVTKTEESSIYRLSLILIISGALGNILDRLPDGVVTDFLFFHVGNTSFFIFNFADAFISIGAALFFLTEFKKFLQNRSQ